MEISIGDRKPKKIKRSHVKILDLKSTITEMKNSLEE